MFCQQPFKALLLLISMGLSSSPAISTLSIVEQQLNQQLKSVIKNAEVLDLNSASGDFLAIYTLSRLPAARGGIILLHGPGAHADWPEVISPLRSKLPKDGWSTLSLQLPVTGELKSKPDYDHYFELTKQRIEAALLHYKVRGVYNIIIIAHSLSALHAMHFLTGNSPLIEQVTAMISLSLSEAPKQQSISQLLDRHAKLGIPFLDVIGDLDDDHILDSAHNRQIAFNKVRKTNYFKIHLSNGDHFFSGLNDTIVSRIRSWLDKQAPGLEIDVKDVKSK